MALHCLQVFHVKYRGATTYNLLLQVSKEVEKSLIICVHRGAINIMRGERREEDEGSICLVAVPVFPH